MPPYKLILFQQLNFLHSSYGLGWLKSCTLKLIFNYNSQSRINNQVSR